MRVLELYCGVGGVAAALGLADRASDGGPFDEAARAEIVAAVDQSEPALAVYRHNFPRHPTVARRVDTLDPAWLKGLDADLWWASPPCQPFTRRGKQRGLDDPRAATFRALLGHLDAVRPPAFALENVEGFGGSDGHDLLRRTLAAAGYEHVREFLLCPSELGAANRRPRFYLLASRRELRPVPEPAAKASPAPQRPAMPALPAMLDDSVDPDLWLDDDLAARYRHALHVVDSGDEHAVTNCFTSAYGRSPVRSGSYLRDLRELPGVSPGRGERLRRFSPAEILRLLGFPDGYRLPPGLRRRGAYRLVGNSLSLPAVRRVLRDLPEGVTDGRCPSPSRSSGRAPDRRGG